jgi:hypothetical protein
MLRSRTTTLLLAGTLTACGTTPSPSPHTAPLPVPNVTSSENGYTLHLNMCGWIVGIQGFLTPMAGEALWARAGCSYVRSVP